MDIYTSAYWVQHLAASSVHSQFLWLAAFFAAGYGLFLISGVSNLSYNGNIWCHHDLVTALASSPCDPGLSCQLQPVSISVSQGQL